ncbi:MAG: OmpH family outer membrane protein [Rikenellaceae bacterium]
MKKITLLILVALASTLSPIMAQNYMVVESKKIFESLSDYTAALTRIEAKAQSYQSQVDAKFDEVEALYNTYMQRQNSLTTVERGVYESKITQMETSASEYQQSLFGADGELFKYRLEQLSPIQTKVFSAVESYAKSNGFDLVLDYSTTSSIMYRSDAVERTDEIIKLLKR